MGNHIRLKAADGHEFQAYCAGDAGSRAALVLIQEIFGVNAHIRSVADDYASQGFLVIAPALFDRVRPNLQLGYEPADVQQGMRAATQLGLETALKDVDAALRQGAEKARGRKVAVLGFCFGGTLAWLAATRLAPAAAVCYYGGRIAQHAAENPRCPAMLHFGAKDPHIGPEEIKTIREHHPDLPLFLYDAGHGFNCEQRKDYDPQSAGLARQRTLEFLHTHL
jgi:carboxymethylenebutenolidase